jgi:hypothetical protein
MPQAMSGRKWRKMITEENAAHLKRKLVGQYATQEIGYIAWLALIWDLKRLKKIGG